MIGWTTSACVGIPLAALGLAPVAKWVTGTNLKRVASRMRKDAHGDYSGGTFNKLKKTIKKNEFYDERFTRVLTSGNHAIC